MALPTNCSHSYNRSMTSLTKPGVSYLFLTLINKDIKYLTENSKVQTYNTVCLKSVLKLIRKKQKYVNFTYFKFPTFLSLLSSFVWWPGIRNTVLILPPICSKFRQFAKQLYARGCIKQSIWHVHELQEAAAAVCDVTDFTLDDEFDAKNKWYFCVLIKNLLKLFIVAYYCTESMR